MSKILDHRGNPITISRVKARTELGDVSCDRRRIHASYDAADSSTAMASYWSSADTLDADSAHSKGVRVRLVSRSRYEVGNNAYADGMVQTYANYLVGIGPSLRMQTRSPTFNSMVEAAWTSWAKEVRLRRKLWCMAHAKAQDGEAFGMIRNNPNLRDNTQMDVVLFETEQCTTPYLPVSQPGYIDGIRFDQFGNPTWYDVLQYHPGGQWFPITYQQPERVPAKFILHWFSLRRPGQHRGIPEFRSTLNVGAQSREWRQSTLSAADTAAKFSVLLKSALNPDGTVDPVAAMSEQEIRQKMMVALPMGWDAFQMKAEHPNATYEAFNRAQISEQGRPKSIPYNIAACDSSAHNFSSGKLDAQGFYITLDVDREDANEEVLDRIFPEWYRRASVANEWRGDPDSPPPHTFDWPKHPVADIKTEAEANDIGLKNGTTHIRKVLSDAGKDYDDVLPQMAEDLGITPEEMKAILRQQLFPAPPTPPQASPQANADTQPTPAGGQQNGQ